MVPVPYPDQLPAQGRLCSGGRPCRCTYQGPAKEYPKVGHGSEPRTSPLSSGNSQELLNRPSARGYCLLKHTACFHRTFAKKCCRRSCRIPFPIMGLSSAPVRNQAEGAEGAAGGHAAISHAATGSSPPSGGGGGPVPNSDDSPEYPNRGKNQARIMAGNRGIRPQRTSLRCEAASPARAQDRGGVPPPLPDWKRTRKMKRRLSD